MTSLIARDPEQLRQSCIKKVTAVEISLGIAAVLAFLLDHNWLGTRIDELRLTDDGALLVRSPDVATFSAFPNAEFQLIRSIRRVARETGLDADELGYVLGRLEETKRPRPDPMVELDRAECCASNSSACHW